MRTRSRSITVIALIGVAVLVGGLIAVGIRRAEDVPAGAGATPMPATGPKQAGGAAGNPFLDAMRRAATEVGKPVPEAVRVRVGDAPSDVPLRALLSNGGIVMTYVESCHDCVQLLALRSRLAQAGQLADADRFWLVPYQAGAALPEGAPPAARMVVVRPGEDYYAIAGAQVMPTLWRYGPGARLDDYLVGFSPDQAQAFLMGGPGDATAPPMDTAHP